MNLSSSKPLNRDVIKLIAMAAMLLNHIAHVFLIPGTFLFELLVDIGYFTAITMCYFLVEGYAHTRSPRRYGLRLALFAAISQFPFCLAFSGNQFLRPIGMNMMFTLLLCFLILLVLDRPLPVLLTRRCSLPPARLKKLLVLALIFLSIFSDWALFAPAFTILFYRARGCASRQARVYRLCAIWFGCYNFVGNLGNLPLLTNLLSSLGASAALAVSGLCILCFYNGKRSAKGQTFFKWFFYLFYPLHLLVLGCMRISFLQL